MNDNFNIHSSVSEKKNGAALIMESMKRFSDVYTQFEIKRAEKFGLSLAEARCILLFQDKRYTTVKELADIMNLGKSRIVRIVDSMESKHLAERFPDPADGRIVLIGLTSDGKTRLIELRNCCEETLKAIWNNLPDSKRDSFPIALDELTSTIKNIIERELNPV
jgi:DNA-binding MarR family transcriptional regulator